ncbi:unnamed protein product [Ilex paraguariensis]|uniref:Protein kinase domain-containing protein n=1 Tax=Ilex paraguariensis TaxID=185542 RepID=A0ABC8TCL8_9AQUA
MYVPVLMGVVVILALPTCRGDTDPRDVFAINGLYAALGFPPLPGWVPVGGDPCALRWQGVQCVNANITGIILNGANLEGQLGESLNFFASIIKIDLSNNHIGGSIPFNLPITIRNFFLSGNQFSGSIPDTLSLLGQLSDLSLNDNHLTGVIPDAFQQLTGLINLDLSGNSLSGQLPPSMGNLSSLTTLHLQNNTLTGTLNVLLDLPLIDLNIENNLFSGPVPGKLLNIPNFRRAGNPFNTTIIPSPPASPPSLSPSPSPSGAPPPKFAPGRHADGPYAPEISHSAKGGKFLTIKSIGWVVIVACFIFIVLALTLCIYLLRCCQRGQKANKNSKRHETHAYSGSIEGPDHYESLQKPYHYSEKVSKETVARPPVGGGKSRRSNNLKSKREAEEDDLNRMAAVSKHSEDHEIDMTGSDANILPPPPPPQPPFTLLSGESASLNSPFPPITLRRHTTQSFNRVKSFTIASLQVYTNSFSQENLIGEGMVGTVFRAELPNGKLLAVKKLDAAASRQQSDEEFLELVHCISKLQHANIVELVGYCAEHGQRLLVYAYCRNGTLHDALHLDDDIHKKFSWNARIRLALQAARALEYLHEVCEPPLVHQNFKSANVLLDDELVVRVSDCGLASLISSSSMAQLQSLGYGAPELELGSYAYQSDVYSFGVVMLELLTGRKSFDRSRPRGEQFLVRWAIPQLHDINALSRMVDPSLNGAYLSKSLSRFADIISLCVQPEPEFRPPMSEIVQNLLHMIQRDT